MSTRMSHLTSGMSLGRGGRRGVNLPPGTKRTTRPSRSLRCAPTAAPLWRRPRLPTSLSTLRDPLLLRNPRRDREVPARFLLDPKQTPQPPPVPVLAPRPHPEPPGSASPRPPLTRGLRRGAAPGGRDAWRPAPEQQQAAEPEEGGAESRQASAPPPSLPASGSGGGSTAEPSPPSLRAPQPVPRCRRPGPAAAAAAAPARPGPARAAPLAGGEIGAPPSCREAERGESGEGEPVHSGAGGGGWVRL